MNALTIDPEIKALIPPLSPEEYERLERALLAEGCRDPLVVWKERNTLVDGHHRYELCQRHNIPYKTHLKAFGQPNDVFKWMLENQLARRNLTEPQRIELALKLKEFIPETERPRTSDDDPRAGRMDRLLGQKASVGESKFRHGEIILTQAPDFVRAWYRSGIVSAHGGYQLHRALEGAPACVAEVIEQYEVTDYHSVSVLARLARNGTAEPHTFDEIAKTGYIQNGDEAQAVHVTSGAQALEEAIAARRKTIVHLHLQEQEKECEDLNHDWKYATPSGSEAEAAWGTMHKVLFPHDHYMSNVDGLLISGISNRPFAFLDFKKQGDDMTWTGVCLMEWHTQQGIPCFLVRGIYRYPTLEELRIHHAVTEDGRIVKRGQFGEFKDWWTIERYVSGDPAQHDPLVFTLETVFEGCTLGDYKDWEASLFNAYHQQWREGSISAQDSGWQYRKPMLEGV